MATGERLEKNGVEPPNLIQNEKTQNVNHKKGIVV